MKRFTGIVAAAALAACDHQITSPRSIPPTGPLSVAIATIGAPSEMPALSSGSAQAWGVNGSGTAVGYSSIGAGQQHAFVHILNAAAAQDLGTLPGGTSSVALAINDAGVIAGASSGNGLANNQPVKWVANVIVPLAGRPTSPLIGEARDINASGLIVGYWMTTSSASIAGYWLPDGTWVPLATPPGTVGSRALGVNDRGDIVGSSDVTTSGPSLPTVWFAPGYAPQTLTPAQGFNGGVAMDINEAGYIVGGTTQFTCNPFCGSITHPAAWASSTSTGVKLIDMGGGFARGVSEDTIIVGGNTVNGFAWTPQGGITSLSGMNALRMNGLHLVVGSRRVSTVDRPIRFQVNPNRPPTASVGGPYSGAEGVAVALNLGGSDPENDALTFHWDFGDGTEGSGGSPPSSHTYLENGDYSIRLVVDDGRGSTDTKYTTASIANAAPIVSASGPAAAILVGGTAPIDISFADAGSTDRHTATIDCGNGDGEQPIGSVTSPLSSVCSYATVGKKTVTVRVTDDDGAVGTATTYVSVSYGFVGFSAPVDNPEVMNVAKAGQTVPFKWRLLDQAGAPVSTLSAVSLTVAGIPCTAGSSEDQVTEYSAGASGLQNLGNGYYQFNWKTPTSYANSCKMALLDVGDGLPRRAYFKFSK